MSTSSHSDPGAVIQKFRKVASDLGGYEADFLYIASFVASFDSSLKLPEWTFVGLRAGLEPYSRDPVMRNILRRCLGWAGRPVIVGTDGADSSRIDKAITKLLSDCGLEAAFYFPSGSPELIEGFNALPVETRARIVRFVIQNIFDTPSSTLTSAMSPVDPVVGMDSEGHRYLLMKDSILEVGCWREVAPTGLVELLATSTDVISSLAAKLRGAASPPERAKNVCVYCRKKVSSGSTIYCKACEVGCCHFSCLPATELTGLPWSCSSHCHQLNLAKRLQEFVDEVEPLQKAAMRKKRRLQSEIKSLQLSDGLAGVSGSSRRLSRGRTSTGVDYSFRDYDRFMNAAIRKSEQKTDFDSSEEDIPKPSTTNLSREERMALRERRQQDFSVTSHVPHEPSIDESLHEEFLEEEYQPDLTIMEQEDVVPLSNIGASISEVGQVADSDPNDEPAEHPVDPGLAPSLEITDEVSGNIFPNAAS